MRPLALCTLALALTGGGLTQSLPAAAAEYHWVSPIPSSWPAPGNWLPPRTTALSTDRLVFDQGGTPTAQNVQNVTVGQIVVSGGTQLTMTSGAAGNALTIGGDTGPDFEVAPGSSITLTGANALLINLSTGATAAIGGSIAAAGGGHRFEALDTDAIVIQSGGSASTLTGFSGSLFGDGTGASAVSSVRFQAGSTYSHVAGSNPFAAGQPASVVTFDHGSLYRLNAAVTPSLSGRTYANFEYNAAGAITATGGSPCAMDSIVVNGGAFNVQLTGNLLIHGSVRLRPTATLVIGPPSGSLVCKLDGSATQAIMDSSLIATPATGFSVTPTATLVIDNPSGVLLTGRNTDFSMHGTLQFVHGLLVHTTTLPFAHTSMFQDPPTVVTGASPTTGWYAVGSVIMTILAANPSRRMDFGSLTSYSPIDLVLHGSTGSTKVVGETRDPTPNPFFYTGNQLDPLHRLSKAWEIDFFDTTSYSSFDATFGFDAGSITPGTDPLQFASRVSYIGPGNSFVPLIWHSTTTGARTATGIGVLGVTRQHPGDNGFDFVVGQPSTVRVSALDGQLVEGNSGNAGPTLPMRLVLSEKAVDPAGVSYQLVNGSATAGADYTALSGTISFAPGDTAYTIQVPVYGDLLPEADETFALQLSGPFSAVLDRGVATGTILDDDDVTPPSVAVLAPNGGETIVQGAPVDLTWSAVDNVAVGNVDLLLSRDNGATWESIATGVPNTGTYPWTATGPLTQLARLKVIASDVHAHVAEDASDAVWSIWNADGVDTLVPLAFALAPVSPNPSRQAMQVRYALPREEVVRMAVLDVRGRLVAQLVDGALPAGEHVARWDGRTANGRAAAGVYFVRMRAGTFEAQRRFVLLH